MLKKSYDHTCNNTLASTRNVIDNVRTHFLIEIKLISEGKKIRFYRMNNRDLVGSFKLVKTISHCFN